MTTYVFHVNGMHCSACKVLTESEIKELPGVHSAVTSLKDYRVEVTGEFAEQTKDEVMHALNEILKPHGYTLSLEAEVIKVRWSEFSTAVPVALIFVVVYIALQYFNIVNLVHTSNITYGTAFVIGVIASVSTCMAVIGGIVLSISASYAKAGDAVRPQAMFHLGRLASFFVLGGVIGVLGSVFRLGVTGELVLGLIVALVLFILGVNLLDVFPSVKKWQLAMPTGIGKRIRALKNVNHILTPLVIGIATFFFPCGFTQSMQIYTLTTGNFWKGGLTMLSFALGTLPVLALLSFSSLGIQKKTQSGIFFKSAGLIVIFFAIFNLISTLVSAGIINPVFNF